MAVELIIKSKKLAEAVESLYSAAYAEGHKAGDWAIVAQVWTELTGGGARIRMAVLPKHFVDQISDILVRAADNAARKRKRKAKAKP
jgi:hypothetical protein